MLANIHWDGIMLESPVLERGPRSVFKVDLPANFKHPQEPDMTLVEHPDHFGTVVHARQVLERMKVHSSVTAMTACWAKGVGWWIGRIG